MSKHHLSDPRFEPLGTSNTSDREVLDVTKNVALSRPKNSSGLGRLLISVTPNSVGHEWLVEPLSQPSPVKWGGIGHIDFHKNGWRTSFFRLVRRTLSIIVTLMLLLIIVAQLVGVMHFRIVLSGSMRPSIKRGDMVVTVPPSLSHPHIGSVVVYEVKNLQGQGVAQVSHRIISGDGKHGWIVKGDANKGPDDQRPTTKELLGVVIAVLPGAGYLANPLVGIFIILMLITFWGISGLRRRRRRSR
jgi:signal peptidase I